METWLKNSLEGHESPIPIGGWKGLHQTRKKKNRQAYYWFLAASILLFAGISIWQFGDLSLSSPQQSDLDIRSGQYPNTNEKEKTLVEKPISAPIIPDKETQSDEPAVVSPVPPIQTPVTLNPKNKLTEEPISAIDRTDAVSIKSIKPETMTLETGQMNPALKRLNEQLQPRKRKSWTFFAETGMAYGMLHFVPDGKANQPDKASHEEYQSIIDENDLSHREYAIGLGAYRQLFAHWSLGTGVQFVKSSMEGVLDYTRQGIAFDPFSVSKWQNNETLIENNFRYAPDILTWRLRTPVRLRYQLFDGNSPLLECGGNYSYTFRSTGNWIDPQSLEPVENQKNLAITHRFSPEFGLGYQWKVGPTRVAAWYRFLPYNRLYQPAGGSMEAKLHTLSIQWQMSH